ncbi:hypothetical protein [Sinorhizobium meliloti]|uniref:Uncharacterized protein n=1 Tax=Sinorhizobium kummerowiae TaxID=158892 RepID=A0ABY8T1V5_9HYPH|nr:hypothetical protein [Sinorhizobium meliloti]WHS91846.1 hypothetical protein PZL22_000456 [Sinorhizobium kummerowiae]WRW48274.1 hypothetical protein VPK21_001527 [Sinorhizobium kummerowiae]
MRWESAAETCLSHSYNPTWQWCAAPAFHPGPQGGIYRFGGIWRGDTPPGPAAAWLLNQFLMLGAADIEEAGLSDI